ncbi:UDP-N-acetylbacillosamine N-acetyltransferase [Polystyrenella longa]|uniref:UDP-N-acetylbacillosamine N-acetyltransferase n=1 Tax=Polystyrenella longa TaxID=2528007 RepID=A0A518CGP0_9PLAN|nr:NeuD/PglB/VioB family sugar acetyltransferase [Polystyrenella longa]QDU78395.1 UDP-N-acetylbacillosamine N-acetyltransferase [Polystyrenella longa]
MTKQLLIIGAGGLGREVLTWALAAQQTNNVDWKVAGFLDSNRKALTGYPVPQGYSVVGDANTYKPTSNEVFVCAIGDPAIKLKMSRQLRARGGVFTNVIHPTALIGPGCQLGTGIIACPFVTLTTNVEVHDDVVFNIYSGCGHDSVIGAGSLLNGKCEVNGNAKLGEGVFMGCQSAVLPGVKVGDFCRIGAGSVVVRNTRAHTTVMGVPAKKLYSQTDFQQAERKAA